MSQNNGNPSQLQAGAAGGSGDAESSELSLTTVMRQMALQNSRLLDLLESLTGGAAAVPSRSSPENVIEALSSSIKEFHFDPENGYTFDRWFSKYEDLFKHDGRSLDDAAKVRLLLRSLSVPVHEKFLNYLLPSHPRDFSFEEVVDKLKKIFGVQKSLFSKRYDCLQIIKNEADDYVSYAGTVNRQCENFELQKLTVDQFKSLVFICGLQSTKDVDVRTRLLSKLESEPAEAINLEGLVTECQRLSNLKHDTAMVEKQQFSSIHAVRHNKDQSNEQSKSIKTGKLPPSPCWQCGSMHFVKDCQFSKHICEQCGRMGHKEGYCSCCPESDDEDSTEGRKKRKAANSTMPQSVKQVRGKRRYVNAIFNRSPLELQLDSGSDITVISRRSWKKIGAPKITTTSMEAQTASGKSLELIGEFTCLVTIANVPKTVVCFVTPVEDLNVIGLDWLEEFDLWSKPLGSICKIACTSTPAAVLTVKATTVKNPSGTELDIKQHSRHQKLEDSTSLSILFEEFGLEPPPSVSTGNDPRQFSSKHPESKNICPFAQQIKRSCCKQLKGGDVTMARNHSKSK